MPVPVFDMITGREAAAVTPRGGCGRDRWEKHDQAGSWKRLRHRRTAERKMAERACRSRQASLITLIAIAAVLTSIALGGITASIAAERAPAVSVISAREGRIIETVRVFGSLVAQDEALVHVDEDGMEIVDILAEAGERVEQGAVLARLDSRPIEIELTANEARLLRADAGIAQAKSQIDDAAIAQAQARLLADRSRALQTRGVVSQEVMEERDNALARAGSMLAVARQSLSLAKADRQILNAERSDIQRRMDLTAVRATAAGVILRRNAKVGAVVTPSGEPLFAIASNEAIELDGEVPEAGFARLRPKMTAEIMLVGQDEPLSGSVRLLSGELDPQTRLGRVRIELEGQGLTAGAFAQAKVAVASATGVLVPATAVLTRDDSTRIQVVEDDILVERDVATGLRAEGLVEIRSGLKPGEQIVLKAANFLSPGNRILPVEIHYEVPEAPDSTEPRLTLAMEQAL